jgi:hypothetical protein
MPLSPVMTRQQITQGQAIAPAGQLRDIAPANYISRAPGRQLYNSQQVPSKPVGWMNPIVYRGQRRIGMRYLYARGAVRQPISQLGTGPDLGVAVWSSDYQPDFFTLHDWGFNDALFQAGYPGFNLGLSFKVPVLPTNMTGGPGKDIKMHTPNILINIQRVMSTRSVVQTKG